jgi:hypothetical protein
MSIPDRGDDARKEVRANGAQPCCPANNFVAKRRWSDSRDGRKNSPPIQSPAQDRLPCQSRRAQAAQDSDLNFLSRMIPGRPMALLASAGHQGFLNCAPLARASFRASSPRSGIDIALLSRAHFFVETE